MGHTYRARRHGILRYEFAGHAGGPSPRHGKFHFSGTHSAVSDVFVCHGRASAKLHRKSIWLADGAASVSFSECGALFSGTTRAKMGPWLHQRLHSGAPTAAR